MSFWALGVIVAATAIPMIQLWRSRERSIRRAIARRENQARVEAELPLLDRCIDLLVAEYGADTFARDMLVKPPPSDADRRRYVNTLIAIARERWQVTPASINISLVPVRSRDREAGTFISMSANWIHEFAHGVLDRDRVVLPGVADNEVLTDIAAALSGFGGLMLSLQRRVVRGFRGKALTWSVGGPGYLWPPALEHIIWRHRRLLADLAAT